MGLRAYALAVGAGPTRLSDVYGGLAGAVDAATDIPYRQLLLRADPGPVTIGDAAVSLLSARVGSSVGGIVLGGAGGGGGGGTALDAFNRPDENPLAGGWLNMGGIPGLQLLAQQAAPVNADFTGNGSYWTTPFPADFRASVSVPVVLAVPGFGSNSARISLYVNPTVTAPSLNGFSTQLQRQGDGTYTLGLTKTVNGTTTTPGGVPVAIPFTAGDVIGIERTGTVLKSWRRTAGVWVSVQTFTDASFPGALLAALAVYDDGLAVRLDDFGTGPFTAGTQAGAALGASGMVLGPFSSGPLKLSSLYAVGAGSTLSILGVPY